MEQDFIHILDVIAGALNTFDALLFPETPIRQIALVEEGQDGTLAAYVPDVLIARESGVPELVASASEQEMYAVFLPDFEKMFLTVYYTHYNSYECVFPGHPAPSAEIVAMAIAAHEVRHRHQLRRKPTLFSRSGSEKDPAFRLAHFLLQAAALPADCSTKTVGLEYDARCIEAMIVHLECVGAEVNEETILQILMATPRPRNHHHPAG